MKTIGMIEGKIEPQTELVGAGETYRLVDFRPNKSGVVRFLVTGGQRVKSGDLLGVVRDVWGDKVDEVFAAATWIRH